MRQTCYYALLVAGIFAFFTLNVMMLSGPNAYETNDEITVALQAIVAFVGAIAFKKETVRKS